MGQSPLFESVFSTHSYGFRPGRSAHQAVQRAQEYSRAGYDWVVDIDLEKFFDRVNHDMLTARVGRVVKDKRVLKLIRAYLNSGVMETMERIRHLTKRTRSGKLEDILSEINRYLTGWIAYFRRAATPSIYQERGEWIRGRLRQLLWKRWKKGTTRYREWM